MRPSAILALLVLSCDPDAGLDHHYASGTGGAPDAGIVSQRGGSAEQSGGSVGLDASPDDAEASPVTSAVPDAMTSAGGATGVGGNVQIEVGTGGRPWPAMTGNPDYHPPAGGAPGAGGASVASSIGGALGISASDALTLDPTTIDCDPLHEDARACGCGCEACPARCFSWHVTTNRDVAHAVCARDDYLVCCLDRDR